MTLPAVTAGLGARGPWLVSRPFDVAVFGGSAALAFALLLWGRTTGVLDTALPAWTWLATVIGVDVAHVWATAWRVYADPAERRRRSALYAGVPIAAWTAGVVLYSVSALAFWRVLAYVAVAHFVRQQTGWVALYRRRLGSASRLDRVLDDAAVYAATLWPLVHWHAHLPREFAWLVAGDFVPGLPAWVASWLWPIHVALLAVWLVRQIQLATTGRPLSPGKCLVVATTWLTWYTGIVLFDSDYAFTVTNVLVHGIPYVAFVWAVGKERWRREAVPARAAPVAGASAPPRAPAAAPAAVVTPTPAVASVFRAGRWPLYVAPLLALAFSEEWLWDRLVWHERGDLFVGPAVALGPAALALVVPLLALPQATHYVLDAWIWRVRENPGLARELGF